MIVIGLNGDAGAGKDTAAAYLGSKYSFKRVAFADALKRATLNLDPYVDRDTDGNMLRISEFIRDDADWDWAKHEIPEVRRLLQNMGTEVGRQVLGENCWVDIVNRQIMADGIHGLFCITDMRFPNEFEYVKEACQGWTIRIERPENPLAIPKTHASEQHQPPQADFTVVNLNDQQDNFYAQLDRVVEQIISKENEKIDRNTGDTPSEG